MALAWAAMGLYSIASKKAWLFAVAVSLLIVSHNSLAVLVLVFYVLYITILGQWRDYWLMFLLGIGMVTFFWFPALYERKYVLFDAVQVANPAAYFITGPRVALLGFSGIVAACIAIFIRKPPMREKTFFVYLFIFTLFVVLPTGAFLWRSNFLAHIFQYPFRFLSLNVVIGCWLVGYVLHYLRMFFRVPFIVLCIAFGAWSTVLALKTVQYINLPEGYYTTNEATTTIQNEYMPRWVSQLPTQRAYQKLIFYQGAGT
ncbi:MAG: hypothetical protein NT149_03950, partial [Candidatus Gottesmanbacteria bacterium]|nr:hypothetical protein [Candidatus Gottesmanbacteria bacterium]